MSRPEPAARPRLARGCRLSHGQEPVLLVPEGMLRLNGPGLKIVQCCDGEHTVAQIVCELQSQYRTPNVSPIEEETTAFLEQLHLKRAVDFR